MITYILLEEFIPILFKFNANIEIVNIFLLKPTN